MSAWAVIIAIENYPNIAGGLAKTLPGTNRAAETFRDWVMTAKNVPAANVIACVGPEIAWRTKGTTRQEMKDAFDALVMSARNVPPVDEIYIFYSGHGVSLIDNPNAPAIDFLIGSEFADPSVSGPACLGFIELKERLRIALGPGRHFYFVDACRNAMTKNDIDPNTSLGSTWGKLPGNATSYVLFSAAPGDVARVDSGFNNAVLTGLKGSGRAKAWVGGKMNVTFDSLCLYVQQMMKNPDLEPEKKGPLAADSRIVELVPTPVSNCEVEVIGAGAADQFTLNATDVRNAPRPAVTFAGANTIVALSPEDYLLKLTTLGGNSVPQIDPVPAPTGVDLYDSRKVRFQLGLPVEGAPPPGPPLAAVAEVTLTGPSNARIVFHELATGMTEDVSLAGGAVTKSLRPGQYKTRLQDGNFKLDSLRLDVAPGQSRTVDLAPKVSRGAQRSLAQALPIHGSLVNFSETLSGVPDWNLSLWLAVLGGSRIVAAPDTFSKLKELPLENFANAQPDRSVLYVLAGERDIDKVPFCDIGRDPHPEDMKPVPGLPGLFQRRWDVQSGPLLVTYAFGKDATTTIQTHGLPNRATLLTFANDEQHGRQIQQFVLPIHSLMDRLSPEELRYLQDFNNNPPLPRIRYMSTAQRLFAQQAPIHGNTFKGSDRYWYELLDHKWLDPLMALIACYELIRRGSIDQDKMVMRKVLENMRTYFPGLADTEVIARLVGEAYSSPTTAPLLMDGAMAVSGTDVLPLPEGKLDFGSIWTSWRDAVRMRERVIAA